MIRFIDLGKQIGGEDEEWLREFAFFNTVSCRFIEYDGSQTWNCWTDFERDWKNPNSTKDYSLERFKSLVPDWVPMQ